MIDFPIEKIAPFCKEFAEISPEKAEKLRLYGEILLEWNEKMNLTAITEPEEVVFKHFLDCIYFFKYINVEKGASVIDVGTGAGFPGIVLKIMREDINLTLLDSLNKRITFLNEVIERLGLENVRAVHLRAEDGGKNPELRENFDIATARAVAPLNVLSEYCLPFVKKGGSFVSLKGPAGESEAQTAKKAINELGGGELKLYSVNQENLGERTIIEIKKISQTLAKYPRNSAKISKQPL